MTADLAARQVLMLLEEFAPAQLSTARGLHDQEIDALERDIGRRFCVGHRVFLQHFGATPKGALNPLMYDFEFSDQAIREYYRNHRDESAPGWVFWANIGADPCPFHAYAENPLADNPAIGFPSATRFKYESMWNEITFDAFIFLIEDRFEHREPSGWLWEGGAIPLSEAAAPFKSLQRLMTQLGFAPWISMFNAQCMMRRGETVAWFGRTGNMPDPDDWNFAISGPDPRELREIWNILADHAGLVDRPIRSS